MVVHLTEKGWELQSQHIHVGMLGLHSKHLLFRFEIPSMALLFRHHVTLLPLLCDTNSWTIEDVLILTDNWFKLSANERQNIFETNSANPFTFDFALLDTFKIIFFISFL